MRALMRELAKGEESAGEGWISVCEEVTEVGRRYSGRDHRRKYRQGMAEKDRRVI